MSSFRSIGLGACLAFCTHTALGERGPWPPYTDEPNLEVLTPHIPWAKPCPGKRLRALVIGDFRSQRLCVELMQRLSVDCVAFHCPGGAYAVELGGDARQKELGRQLREPFDLVVAPGNLIGLFPPDLVELLIKRIREGLGFVYLWPSDKPFRLLSELGEVSRPPTDAAGGADVDLRGEQPEGAGDDEVPLELDDQQPVWEREALAYLVRGAPLSHLGGLQPSPGEEGKPSIPPLSVRQCGEGRAVLIGRPGMLSPGSPRLPAPGGQSDLLHEYKMGLVVKAALWAVGREPQVRFADLQPPAGETDGPKLTLILRNAGAPRAIELALAVRSERDLHLLPRAPWPEPGPHRGAAALDAVHAETKSVQLPKGDWATAFSLPSLPSGDYFVDVRLAIGPENINWAVVPWSVPGGPHFAGIVLEPEAVDLAGDTVLRARVDLAGPASLGQVLDAALVDNHHRVLRRQRVPLAGGTRAVELAFDVAGAKTTLLKLRAALSANGRTLDVLTGYFTVYNRPWPTFTYFAWGCGSPSSNLSRQLLRVAAFHGMDARLGGIGIADLRVADLRAIGGIASHHGKVEPGEMIVNPCCTSPAYRAGLRNTIRLRAQSRRISDCFGYTTGDETAYAGGLFAGCGSETCTARLHTFLERQYGTIEALNRQWETEYGDFGEIQTIDDPAAYNEHATKTGNFSARIDQWMANYDAYMDWFCYQDEALENYAPRARFGFMTNCFYGHERGYDFPRMMEVCDYASPYCGWPPYFDCVQQFGSDDLIFGGHNVTRGFDRSSGDSWKMPFWILLRGGRNAFYYLFTIGGEGAVAPYLNLDPCLGAYTRAVKTIKKGLADLLVGAKREADPVAVYYSTPSLIFSSAISGSKHVLHIKNSNRAYRDAGFEPQMLHTTQILAGALQDRGIRVLCLPITQCVSDREAEVLREFVEKGGMLIADCRPGIADEHGRVFAQKKLPALFGLRWDEKLLAKTDGPLLTPLVTLTGTCSAGLGEHKLENLTVKGVADGVLRADGARFLTELDGVPLISYRKVGKGVAICLNIPASRDLLRFLFAAHRITSRVEVQGLEGAVREMARAEVTSFSDGTARYFGVICRYDTKPQGIAIRAGRRGHLYDLLRGEYLGEADRIEVDDFARPVRIFSFLPYRVAGMELQCEEEARPGGMIRGTLKVDTGGATAVRHVVRFTVQRPDGKTVRYLTQNLEAKGGQAAFTIPLALNEPTGQWTLRARDVATGVEATMTFTVEPAAVDGPAPGFLARQHETVPSWQKEPPTVAELVQEYPRASLHRRLDIVDRLRREKPDQASVGLLRQAVQDTDPVLSWSAVTALGALGEKASPAATALGAALRSTVGIRKDILRTFRQIGADAIRQALPSIAECLQSANPRVRFEGLRTIIVARQSKSAEVRHRVIQCYQKNDMATEHLDCNVLAAYIEALTVFPPNEEALPLYCRAVEGFPMHIRLNEDERRTVSHGELTRKLARFTYYQKALGRLHANNAPYRLMAVKALASLGEKAEAAIPAAVRALEDTVKKRKKLDGGTRIQIWLSRQPNPSAPADEGFQVAEALCRFLASHGEKAEPALRVLKRLQDLDPRLAEAAQAAMGKIDPLADAGMELEEGGAAPESLNGNQEGKLFEIPGN